MPRSSRAPAPAVETELLAMAQQYLQACREHDNPPSELCRARNTFYRICNPLVQRTIARCHVSRDDVDDYAQEAWCEVITSLTRFEYDPGRGCFEHWLRTVVKRCVWRHARRRVGSISDRIDLDLTRVCSCRSLEPVRVLKRRELGIIVREALRAFRARESEVSYQVLTLRYIEERTTAEIGELLDLSPGHVRVILHRAIERFRCFVADSERFAALGRE